MPAFGYWDAAVEHEVEARLETESELTQLGLKRSCAAVPPGERRYSLRGCVCPAAG